MSSTVAPAGIKSFVYAPREKDIKFSTSSLDECVYYAEISISA